MKQKTLGRILMGMAFAISTYVLYYTFVGDVANFDMYVLWFGGGLIIMLIPLFICLSDYCVEEDKV